MKWIQKSICTIFLAVSIIACGSVSQAPVTVTTIVPTVSSIPFSITSSHTPSAIPFPTSTYTASPEPDIALNCKIANDTGQLYLVSDQEFRNLLTTPGKLDQVLTVHYPEWANYTQMFPLSTQPVTLGEIVQWASLDEEVNLQINPAVTLVTLGDTLDWQLPSNTDLYLKAQEISTELNRLSLDWENPFDDSLRRQYPEVANSGTYALYIFFEQDQDKLQTWCETYQLLFDASPLNP